MSFDPTIRHSFWSLLIGGTGFWLNVCGMNQSMLQRYMALPSLQSAKKALYINCLGVIILVSLCLFNGLICFAYFYDCDPLTTKLAKAKDQLLPLLVMDVLRDLPGMSGLFIAGVFSASLSSLSTALNALAAVVLEDFYKPYAKKELTERQTGLMMRGTVFFFGILSVALVYAVEHMGSVLQLGMTITSAALGPLLGIFMIGLFLPWLNGRATMIGALIGIVLAGYVSIRAQFAIAAGEIVFEHKPVSVEGCTYDFVAVNATVATPVAPPLGLNIHHMSYLYYSVFGSLITVGVAAIASMKTGMQNPQDLDPKLFAPFLRRFFHPHAAATASNEKCVVTHEFVITNNIHRRESNEGH